MVLAARSRRPKLRAIQGCAGGVVESWSRNYGQRRRTGETRAAETQASLVTQIDRRDTKSAENPKQLSDLGVVETGFGRSQGYGGTGRSTVCREIVSPFQGWGVFERLSPGRRSRTRFALGCHLPACSPFESAFISVHQRLIFGRFKSFCLRGLPVVRGSCVHGGRRVAGNPVPTA